MTPFLAQLLTEAAESRFGLEITSAKPLNLQLALIHALASLPGSGLTVLPSRTQPTKAIWLLRKEVLELCK